MDLFPISFGVMNQHRRNYPGFYFREFIVFLCPFGFIAFHFPASRKKRISSIQIRLSPPSHIMITHNTIEELGRSSKSNDMLQVFFKERRENASSSTRCDAHEKGKQLLTSDNSANEKENNFLTLFPPFENPINRKWNLFMFACL